jgi:hypothetical protein
MPLDWERTGDMGLERVKGKEGVECAREAGRKGMEVSGPEVRGKEP